MHARHDGYGLMVMVINSTLDTNGQEHDRTGTNDIGSIARRTGTHDARPPRYTHVQLRRQNTCTHLSVMTSGELVEFECSSSGRRDIHRDGVVENPTTNEGPVTT